MTFLRLRILDPSMGSGAFLVAACRYVAHAYEAALIRDGVTTSTDLTEDDRAGFRRVVAQKCLYGVDVNPMAVQLARLSLWLATLCRDRPLTFFDRHLRTGNSLAGASIEDVMRRPSGVMRGRSVAPPPGRNRSEERKSATLSCRMSRCAKGRKIRWITSDRRNVSSMRSSSATGPVAHWKRVADLWCAGVVLGRCQETEPRHISVAARSTNASGTHRRADPPVRGRRSQRITASFTGSSNSPRCFTSRRATGRRTRDSMPLSATLPGKCCAATSGLPARGTRAPTPVRG